MSSKYDNVKIKVVVGSREEEPTIAKPKGEEVAARCLQQQQSHQDKDREAGVNQDKVSPGSGVPEHHYILSRYLISRMLTFVTIPAPVALQISLDFKKSLVDRSILLLTQYQMEVELFALMSRYGYGKPQQEMFRVMTTFYRKRVPLIVFILGTGCVGKSTVATHLGGTLNNHNIINTSNVHCMMKAVKCLATKFTTTTTTHHDGSGGGFSILDSLLGMPGSSKDVCSADSLEAEEANEVSMWGASLSEVQSPPPPHISSSSSSSVVDTWQERCAITRAGIQVDIEKALHGGKVLIVEGTELDGELVAATSKRCRRWKKPEEEEINTNTTASGEPPDTESGPTAICLSFVLTLKPEDRRPMRENWIQSLNLHGRQGGEEHSSVRTVLDRLQAVEDEIMSSVQEAVDQQLAEGEDLTLGFGEKVEFDCGNPTRSVDTIHRRVLEEIVAAVATTKPS